MERERAEVVVRRVIFLLVLALDALFVLSRTRLGPSLGLAHLNLLTVRDVALWGVAEIFVVWFALAPARRLRGLIRSFHADARDAAASGPTARPSRLAFGALVLVVVTILVSVEAPTDRPPPQHGARVAERGAYPSLVASWWTGDFVFNPDSAGGLFGLAHVAYPELRRFTVPLWVSEIGTGRPLYPVDIYSLGTLNPLTWLALATSSDTNRAFIATYVFHLALTVGSLFLLLFRGRLDPLAAALGALLLFSGRFLHTYPTYVEAYLLPTTAVIVVAFAIERVMERGTLANALVAALLIGALAVASAICVPVCGMAAFVTCFAAGVARGSTLKEWRTRTALVVLALGLGAALSLVHILPLRLFGAESTNRFLPYIGAPVAPARGLDEFGQYFVKGPLTWSLATLGLLGWASSRSLRVTGLLATTLLLTALLGFLGVFDKAALAVGYNSQRIITYGPLAAVSGAIFAGLGAHVLMMSRQSVLIAFLWFGACILHRELWDEFLPSTPALLGIIMFPAFFAFTGSRSQANRTRQTSLGMVLAFGAFGFGAAVFSPKNSILNTYVTGVHLSPGLQRIAWGGILGLPLAALVVGHAWGFSRGLRGGRLPLVLRRRLGMLHRVGILGILLGPALFLTELSPRNDYLVSSPIDSPVLPTAFAKVVRAAGHDYRITCLYPREGDLPRPFDYIIGDEIPLFPLEAPLYGYHDALGGASLTIARFSDFVDYANEGCRWGDPRFPAEAHRDEPLLYWRLCQFKRINPVALDPYSPLWKYAALRYVISREPLDESRLSLVESLEKPVTYGRHMDPRPRLPKVFIYERRDAYPRVYVPDVVQVVPRVSEEDPATLAATRPEEGRFAIVADPERPRGEQRAPGVKKATIVNETTRSIELQVESGGDGYVVLSDAFFPGWTATLDGQPTTLLIANYAFRAVRIPAGSHRVVMTFFPRAILVGGALSAFVAAFCAGGILWSFRGRRHTVTAC